MKKFSRLLPLSTLMILLLSVLIFSCQKSEIEPTQKDASISPSPEFQYQADAEVQCKLFFKSLSEDEAEALNEMGLEDYFAQADLGNEDDYASTSGGDYCNYVITQIYNEGTCGPEVMDGFCVTCIGGSCKSEGILWSPNGYKARAILFQPVVGKRCTVCNEGVIYPRG